MIKFHDAFEDENNVYVVMDFDSILSDEDAPMRINDFGLSDFVRPGRLSAQKYILIPIAVGAFFCKTWTNGLVKVMYWQVEEIKLFERKKTRELP
ncbi:hypothetical protein POTOM_038520 [Populus tomentosa]|uniref:Protein kinase domain-containing protein n=1 Tax=Populus tomentosa TaxID=118781 RepID=A0A8X7YRJ4_POPTO|nr:hypothetical protein POTOM_038520 [Populus tomentosa]